MLGNFWTLPLIQCAERLLLLLVLLLFIICLAPLTSKAFAPGFCKHLGFESAV